MNWSAQANYTPSYISAIEGFYTEQSISAPNIQPGFGAPDTAKRVGTGEEELGISNIPPEVNGLDQGYDLKMVGATTQIDSWGMHYRTDAMPNGLDDIAGKTILLASPNARTMWNVFTNVADGAVGEAETQYSEQASAPALLARGDVDAVVNTLNRVPVYKSQVQENNPDVDVQSELIDHYTETVGFNMIANGSWVEEESDATEYLARLLSGWSNAAKWTYLNPEEALDILRNDVNPELQQQPKELQLDVMRSGITALNLTSDVKEQGPGYLDQERLGTMFENVANVLEVDAPDAEEIGLWEVQEQAELASFSDDEWSQVQEFTKPYDAYVNQ
jgi:NitT/TauT family transport system substrate-binding protein